MKFIDQYKEAYKKYKKALIEQEEGSIIKIIIETMPDLDKFEDSKLINKFSLINKNKSIFRFLIPSKRREEVMGDLIETKIQMIEEGFPLWKIKAILYCHMLLIVISLLKVKLLDFGEAKKKTDQNR